MAKKKLNEQDAKILAYQQMIKEKKAAVSTASKPFYKTRMVINIAGMNTNIHTLNVETGIDTLAQLIALKSALSSYSGPQQTFVTKRIEAINLFMKDVLTKLDAINASEMIKELAKDEAELETLLSSQYKEEKKLNSILDKYSK